MGLQLSGYFLSSLKAQAKSYDCSSVKAKITELFGILFPQQGQTNPVWYNLDAEYTLLHIGQSADILYPFGISFIQLG